MTGITRLGIVAALVVSVLAVPAFAGGHDGHGGGGDRGHGWDNHQSWDHHDGWHHDGHFYGPHVSFGFGVFGPVFVPAPVFAAPVVVAPCAPPTVIVQQPA